MSVSSICMFIIGSIVNGFRIFLNEMDVNCVRLEKRTSTIPFSLVELLHKMDKSCRWSFQQFLNKCSSDKQNLQRSLIKFCMELLPSFRSCCWSWYPFSSVSGLSWHMFGNTDLEEIQTSLLNAIGFGRLSFFVYLSVFTAEIACARDSSTSTSLFLGWLKAW